MIGFKKKYTVSVLVKRRLRRAWRGRWRSRRLLARQGWLTAPALAKAGKVSTSAVYKWLKAGVPHKKVGAMVVFKKGQVQAWLAAPQKKKKVYSQKSV